MILAFFIFYTDSGNSNNNNAEYNKLPNGDNNNLLTDDVMLDVWAFNNRAAVPISGRVEDPIMKINPASGMLGFAFTNGPLYFSMGGTVEETEYSYMYWQASYDFMTSIAFAYDSAGYSYGSAAGGDINNNAADKFTFMTSHWGCGELTQDGSYNGVNALRLESIGQVNSGVKDFNKQRIQSPSYATSRYANNTNIYLAYFDDMNSEIRFRYGRLPNSSATKTNFGNFFDSETARNPLQYNNTYVSMIAGSATGRNPGEYVSLGVIPGEDEDGDTVVVVWYDATLNRLLYSYNTTPTTSRAGVTDGTGWSIPIEIFTDAGQYCQVAVDSDKGIHIAAYDNSAGDLLYAFLDTYEDSSPETCVVDSYAIAGTNITIDVAKDASEKQIPYIGYYALSSVKPKYAYLVDTSQKAPVGVVNEAYTGAWEATLLPTTSFVPQDRINVGVWKTPEGVLKNSEEGTSTYENNGTGYGATNHGRCFGNGTSNGVLAYQIKEGTKGYIETAQKK